MSTDSDLRADEPQDVDAVDMDTVDPDNTEDYDDIPGTTAADVVTWIFAGVMVLGTIYCIWFVM